MREEGKRIRPLALVLVLACAVAAQESAPGVGTTGAVRHEVRLRGGTILVGGLAEERWKCHTAFGELSVPVHEVKRIRLGRKADPERLARVAELIEGLGDANPERRNFCVAALREEGKFAAPNLKEASTKHSDPEVKRLADEILKALKLKPADFPIDDDRIETKRFSFTGTILQKKFVVHVLELGPVSVLRKDIVELRAYVPSEKHEFKITGANSVRSSWLDTKLTLKAGQRFRVMASGTIMFPQWGGNAFTPDGSFNMGNWAGMPMGSLAGRMGTGGPLFKIGRFYSGTPNGTGTLHVAIAVNVQGMASTGEYKITVEVEDG